MPKPLIRIHNIETDEVIDREMTAAEFKQYELEQLNSAVTQAAKNEKVNARAALLVKLGITPEEAALLLS